METVEQGRMRAVAEAVTELPALPAVVARVVEVTNDANATAIDLARVILTDPAATAKILRIANSAYYSFAKRISTITEAIVVLGLDTVRNTLLTVFYQSMHQELQRQKGSPKVLELWRRSVCTAVVARNLAGTSDVAFREKCYVAGLLNDIGRLVLLARDLVQSLEILQEAERSHRTIEDVERERYGFTHAELGEAVARRWHLPPEICEAIGQHHGPELTMDPKLTATVHAASYVVSLAGIGSAGGHGHALDARARAILSLDEARIQAVVEAMPDVLREADTLSGLAR